MAIEKTNPTDPPPRRPMTTSSTAVRASLEAVAGPEKGQTFRIAPGVTVIGRDASCDVALSETAISRQHARIERRTDSWVFVNLSSNGSKVNKKPAEEVVLADGDEIRIGAATRLVFTVEEVATMPGGRPQFRSRALAREEKEEGKPPSEAEEDKPSLFRRGRKGLFIALLAAIPMLLLVAGIVYKITTSGGVASSRGEIPILGIEDTIVPQPGAKPLRIVGEAPEGVWVETELDERKLIPLEDLRSGKARRLPGIRKALDIKYMEQDKAPAGYRHTVEKQNDALAERYKKEGIDKYLVSDLPGKEAYLLGAVRLFQMSLGYYGTRGFFAGDPAAERVRQEALAKLIKKVHDNYTKAILYEKAGDYRQAWETYRLLMKLVPEEDNPIFDNVSRRMSAIRKQVKLK